MRDAAGALVRREVRILLPRQLELHLAALRDAHRVLQRLRELAEELRHLLARLEIELRGAVLHAVGIRPLVLRLEAEQHLVRLRLVLAEIVHVVRRHERQRQLLRERHQLAVQRRLLRQPVVLQLQEEIPRPHDVRILGGQGFGFRVAPLHERLRHLPLQARRERDDSLVVLREQRTVDARLVVLPVKMRRAHQPHQVEPPRLVLREQHQVVVPHLPVHPYPRRVPVRRDVHLAAHDGLDPVLLRPLVEMHRPVQIPVVRQRDRLLPHVQHPLHERTLVVLAAVERTQPVEQAVLAVHVQMDERNAAGHDRCLSGKGASLEFPRTLPHAPPLSKPETASGNLTRRRGAAEGEGEF